MGRSFIQLNFCPKPCRKRSFSWHYQAVKHTRSGTTQSQRFPLIDFLPVDINTLEQSLESVEPRKYGGGGCSRGSLEVLALNWVLLGAFYEKETSCWWVLTRTLKDSLSTKAHYQVSGRENLVDNTLHPCRRNPQIKSEVFQCHWIHKEKRTWLVIQGPWYKTAQHAILSKCNVL